MAKVTLKSLAARIPGSRLAGDPTLAIQGIAYDSRLVEPGFLFAALRGGYADGHAYLQQAVARGAVAGLVEEEQPGLPGQIVVPDSRAALAHLAAAFYDRPSLLLPVIGITGTDGKTTTSYLTEAILRRAGFRTGMVGTVSVRIGDVAFEHTTRQTTPESLDVQRYLREMVARDVEVAILEATSHGLALHRLDEVHFAIAAVTNITHEHLELHGTVDAYWAAKGLLFERVGEVGGIAVVNIDDAGAQSVLARARGARVIRYSMLDAETDLYAEVVEASLTGSSIRMRWQGETAEARLPLPGRFNVANALCGAGICFGLGLGLRQVVEGLESAEPVAGRMQRIDRGQAFDVIVDYAHTPESLEQILRLLRDLAPEGRLICVSGSAGERDRTKRPLQGAVSARLADYSVFTDEDPRFEPSMAIIDEIAAGAIEAGAKEGDTFVRIPDRREAIARAFSVARPGDVVLLAGKGHERSIIVGAEKVPWDEAAVAAELLTTSESA